MTVYSRLKPLVFLLLIGVSFQSDTIGQQIIPEGVVFVNGQQVTTDLGPSANAGDIAVGDPFFDTFASGRLTVSEGALLNAVFLDLGSSGQSQGVFEAQGFGTSVDISQGIELLFGAVSVTDGAAVNASFLNVSSNFAVAPTVNVSGLASQLSLNSVDLEQGTLNISDGGSFFTNFLNFGNNGFQFGLSRVNLTNGGQAIVENIEFGFEFERRSTITIDENSSLVFLSPLLLGGNNTITLDGGWLIGEQFQSLTYYLS